MNQLGPPGISKERKPSKRPRVTKSATGRFVTRVKSETGGDPMKNALSLFIWFSNNDFENHSKTSWSLCGLDSSILPANLKSVHGILAK